MNVTTKKIELIKWLSSIEDKTIIDQIDSFRKQKNNFDFEKEINSAITADELKTRTTDFLKSLEWKK